MTRTSVFPLLVLPVLVLAGCSKKENVSATPPPATTTDASKDDASGGHVKLDPADQPSGPASAESTPASATGGKDEDLQPPELVHYLPPFYPLSQRMQGIEGRIDLGLTLDATGDVTNVEVISATAPQFSDEATEAARHWHFRPAMRSGQPVADKIRFPVVFVSEYGNGRMPADSPLASLVYIDGVYYTVGADGKMTPAEVSVTALERPKPWFDADLLEGKPAQALVGFTVDQEGKVVDPKIVESSNPKLNDAVLEAVRFWQFVPQIRKGKPVTKPVQVPFKIDPPSPEVPAPSGGE